MSLSTTQYGYIVDPMVPFTDDKGKTIKNGFIRVFMAGTSTPVLTYRNYDGATNQEKIELDNSGRVKHNVIGSKGSLYKVVVYNILHSQENPLLTVDKIAVLGASINASGATIVTGLDSVTVQEENFLKATVEGTGVELALDPTEVTSEVSTTADAVTASPDYVVPLLEKTGTEDSKKISLANLFKFALDWISRLATTITSFASGDFIAVSNTTNGTRKMSKDTLLELTADNALVDKVAPKFVPNSTTTIAGELYLYNNVLYRAKENYNGVWDDNKFKVASINDILMVLEKTQSVTRIYTEDRLVYKRFSDIQGVVQTTTSERASTPAFFVTPNSYLFVRCKGYQIRLTFWNSTAYSASTILNATAPENAVWNSGDEGIFVATPSSAVCAMVSLRKSDNSSFETSLPQVSVYFVENQRFVAGDYDSQKVASSANGLVTLPQKVLIFDKKYYQSAFYVHVNVPSGKRARVIFGYGATSSTYYDVGTLIALDWITANDSVRLPIGANWFCVEFANSDGSAVNIADFKEAYCVGADTNFFGKRLSILGDSISTFGGSADNDPRYAQVGDPTYPGNRCRYPQNDLLTDVNQTYWYRIIHDFGMELGISESWAGSCVSNTQETDRGDLGPNRCMSSQTRINHLAYNGTPDIILVYGGTNDYGRQFPLGTFDYTSVNGYSDAQIAAMPNGTFAEAYKAMLTRLQKTYPNAKIYCITPNFTGGDMGRLDTYIEVVKEACDFFGVQCIDIRSVGINVFNKSSYLPDNLHPNAIGMLLIAEKIRKAMLFE